MAHDLVALDHDPRNATDGEQDLTLKDLIAAAECQAISEALHRNDWVIGKAAADLDISRKSLWEKMKRYVIEK